MIGIRLAFAIVAIALALSLGRPAAAQNPTGQFTAPPHITPPVLIPGGGNIGGGNESGTGGGNGGDWWHHRPPPYYPSFAYPYSTFYPDMATQYVQPQPVNPEPFKPAMPPAFGRQESTKPYAPPSVEIAPGGIEIIRGPG
jgi:hypothetical protein